MIRLSKHYDADGNEVDEDGNPIVREVVKDKGVVSVPLMMLDSRAAAPPPGKYFVCDAHGRPCGLGDVAAEAKRQGAYEDYKQRLANANASRRLRDGKPSAWQWYRDWHAAHGNM